MLRGVALVRSDISEELSASFIRVTGIDELVTPHPDEGGASSSSVLTRTTRSNIPEDTILHLKKSMFHWNVGVCVTTRKACPCRWGKPTNGRTS
jgi:hypothetical protein